MEDTNQPKITVRNLQEFGGDQSPLMEFKGRLDSFGNPTNRFGRNNIILNFTQVQVIETIQPYSFPVAVVSIPYSSSKESRWGKLADSVQQFLREGEDFPESYLGVELIMKKEMKELWDGQQGKKVPKLCWTAKLAQPVIVGAGKSPADRALELLNGKTAPDFYQAAFNDSLIKSDPNLVTAILSKTFLQAMEVSGKVVHNPDGTYTVK